MVLVFSWGFANHLVFCFLFLIIKLINSYSICYFVAYILGVFQTKVQFFKTKRSSFQKLVLFFKKSNVYIILIWKSWIKNGRKKKHNLQKPIIYQTFLKLLKVHSGYGFHDNLCLFLLLFMPLTVPRRWMVSLFVRWTNTRNKI